MRPMPTPRYALYRLFPLPLALALAAPALHAADKIWQDCAASGGTNCTALIPDASGVQGPGQLSSTLTIAPGSCGTIQRVCVRYGIEHSANGDLSVSVTHNGTTGILRSASGDDPQDDLVAGHVVEDTFDGQSGDGDWTLNVTDTANGDYGALNEWSVSLCCGAGCGTSLINVTPTSGLFTTEAGGNAQFELEATCRPSRDIPVTVVSSDTTEGVSDTATVVFTTANWMSPQTVTVTGQDDFVDDGDTAYTVQLGPVADPIAFFNNDPLFAGTDPDDANLVNLDDDTAGVTVDPTSGLTTSEAGGTAQFQIVLTSEPTADVTINVTSLDPSEGVAAPAAVTFTPANWSDPQSITVTGQDDPVVDGDIVYSVAVGPVLSGDPLYAAIDPSDVTLINLDDDSGALVTASKSVAGPFIAGGTVTYTLILRNVGAGAQADNPGDELVDILPAGLTLLDASAGSGTAGTDFAANTVTWNGGLAPGASVTLVITAEIGLDQTGNAIANQGIVAFDTTADGNNNASGVTDDPSTPAANDPTVFTVGVAMTEVPPIPGLSAWSLLVLAGILACIAWGLQRRRTEN